MTPRSLYFAFKAHADERERIEAFELEKMRLQTVALINIHLKASNQITNPRQLFKFAHEENIIEQTEINEISPEMWDKLQAQADKIFNK